MEEQLLRHYGKCKKDAIILSLSQNDSCAMQHFWFNSQLKLATWLENKCAIARYTVLMDTGAKGRRIAMGNQACCCCTGIAFCV